MATETGQTTGQLDEATVLRVLQMVQGYVGEARVAQRIALDDGGWRDADTTVMRIGVGTEIADRLVAMYRASLGLEKV